MRKSITEGLLGGVDFLYAMRFLRLLTMNWKKTGAYKAGIIDQDGKVLRKPETSRERDVYNIFHRLVFNVKRLIQKVPIVGRSALASYAAALWLIKEETGISEKKLTKQLSEASGENIKQMLALHEESPNGWFLIEGTEDIQEGIYALTHDIDLYGVKKNSLVNIQEHSPVGTMFGFKLYQGHHYKTGQKVTFTQEDITRTDR